MADQAGVPKDHTPSPTSAAVDADVDDETQELRSRIDALLNEVAALREVSRNNASLSGMVEQLREANQNLVVATVEAQTMRDEAESANRRQNEFLAMLAHELRNPLASIGMAATLIERLAKAHPDLPKLHSIIQRQTDQMARLLDDLLDAARVSSGKIVLARQPVLLSEILESAAETSAPYINRRNQVLTLELADEPLVIDGDRVRLAQVFSNLLVNAAKFTPDEGQIRLRAVRAGNEAIITVEDNGTGIAADVLPHIFNLFTQGPRSLARSEGGLGVGLTVVRSLVHMHAGTVEARSDGLGHGSVFTVALPLSEQRRAERSPEMPAPAASCCKVLLVEDNVDASATLKALLDMEGHHVACAFDGRTGLAMAMENDYDVIISDLGLPGIDGFEMMKRLRENLSHAAPLAIAVTGYGQLEDRTRASEAGFDHCLVKPIDSNALLSLIAARATA
jgi:signal transduction histidine kinase/ActR/RegA family two-component response regulator